MYLTVQTLLNDPEIVKAVIDRVQALRLDTIFWKKHLDFEETKSRVFKTYLGTVTGVTAGSVIDRNSNKPLRERKSLGSGYGEVAYLGDRYQMDNDRLDMLQELVTKYNNARPADQQRALNDIINYIVDDYRQVLLAPHKRMDLVDGALRSDGKATVKVDDNPQGIAMLDMELPVHRITPTTGDKSNFIKYLMEQVVELRTKFGMFVSMEMSRKTFIKSIVGSKDFGDFYKQSFAQKEVQLSSGLMSSEMATTIFQGLGFPPIVINEDLVELADGTMKQVFKDNRISLFTTAKQGKMRWHTPYEITDPVPGKNYTRSEGGMYISNVRTEEGRFMEYGCEWIPEYTAPNKIVILDLDTMLA
ncbi:hypothetical protein [Paraprevotella clara]|uniref:Phage major capsid protein E n=1 Tax=Paraprevotella clara YIT 11840 TaxID=762968 RepID=G5SMK2_9BACT|nr:hypothetical protein [Paraprevotella clara]EHH01554.1 hypothetical protein HMPREF9441_00577 [Paraprevotella clara YIT 11840]